MGLVLDAVVFLARQALAMEQPSSTLLTAAGNYFNRIDESDLTDFFSANPEHGDTGSTNSFVFLPMVRSGQLLPVLNLRYNLAQDTARLQVAVFVQEGVGQVGPRAFGYRFEPPEGANGPHHFWHAQPTFKIRLPDGDMRELPPAGTGSWRPTSTPAFPLDASSSADLLVCLMVSLYGLQGAAEMQASHFGNRLAGSFAAMRCRG